MGPEGASGLPVIKVLLVEDNPTDRALVEGLLRRAAQATFDVTAVATLAGAFEALVPGAFDALLLDLFLPDSEGLDTFLSVRDVAADIPTVVLTGAEETDLGLHCVQAGAQDFLSKGKMVAVRLSEALLYAVERWDRNREQALYDPLTGLATKHLLLHRLSEAITQAEREGEPVAVITVHLGLPAPGPGLDRRATSDLVAVAAERIRTALRPFDILARTGFETFAAIVPGLTRPANAERAGQRVLGALVGELAAGELKARLAARVGVAWGRHALNGSQLLERAWAATYNLKKDETPGLRMAPG